MKHDFYLKIMPAGILKKVGVFEVPPKENQWSFPIKKELSLTTKESSYTPDTPMFEQVDFYRTRTITGDVFIAITNAKIQES